MREPEDSGDVVEVAREVRPDDLQVQQDPGLHDGQVSVPQPVRGGGQDGDGTAQVRQSSAFQRFLVKKPSSGFVVNAAASD